MFDSGKYCGRHVLTLVHICWTLGNSLADMCLTVVDICRFDHGKPFGRHVFDSGRHLFDLTMS
jgi:hypothetical protein